LNEVKSVLKKIQLFEPAGIGACSLQECLILQLKRQNTKDTVVKNAIKILEDCFEEFTKKHYDKIQKKLELTVAEQKKALNIILKLNPKPGESVNSFAGAEYIIPDFILTESNGELLLSLNKKNAPQLKISRSYAEMLDTYEKSNKKDKNMRQTATFIKQKLDSAKWFIDAIKQREETLRKTMSAIVKHQREFFLTGDESKLRPMILKDVANEINMDISTVSRVVSSKAVQTDFGLFQLKYFFSESISTETGEDVSSREVKSYLKELIENEDKKKPLSDDRLEELLNEKGYSIARRTVAKYREQLNIPVARLRKEMQG
jgi:RNA polymerase sigma-54 factor